MIVRIIVFGALVLSASAKESHWAYLAPEAEEVSEGVNPVDALLAVGWRERGLVPAALAEPGVWLERAAYTLTGLPPSAEQQARIAASPDELTWSGLVDELLASPAYGERWARHWMDVARYADTQGYNFDKDNRYPYAYTYRDWLIRAFNRDLRYDEFVKLQVAADELVEEADDPDLAALGFLTVGPRIGGVETIDDRVDVITRGFLSTTVACARCHDHKTDPITQEDYYSFYSILENTSEQKPVIGKCADDAAYAGFREEKRKLEEVDLGVRQGMVDAMRSQERLAIYLELGWRAKVEDWDAGRASAEGFKRGRYRPKAIMRWKAFLAGMAWGEKADPRLREWAEEMAGTSDRAGVCGQLAGEWISLLGAEGELAELAKGANCPLSLNAERIRAIFDQQDGNEQRSRQGAMLRLETEHAGAPPRAMAIRDREKWAPAQVYRRGSPSDRGEPFARQWLSVLGGGVYEVEGKSPRLAMAERIADRANPLTARVIVNRVWGWHFGEPLANPGDFGPQEAEPVERVLLDHLAVWLMEHQWSLKQLHRLLLSSRAFRLAAEGAAENDEIDEGNIYFWKWTRRRRDFESMRDGVLWTAGALKQGRVGGRSVDLLSAAADSRRSVYAFIDRYALPGVFVNFDVPHPDHHAPKRSATIVPQQALYFLNNTLPVRQAAQVVGDAEFQGLPDAAAKVAWVYGRIYRRVPSTEEVAEVVEWVEGAGDPAQEGEAGDVWADLVQMLWASNEFHYID